MFSVLYKYLFIWEQEWVSSPDVCDDPDSKAKSQVFHVVGRDQPFEPSPAATQGAVWVDAGIGAELCSNAGILIQTLPTSDLPARLGTCPWAKGIFSPFTIVSHLQCDEKNYSGLNTCARTNAYVCVYPMPYARFLLCKKTRKRS